MIATDEVHAIRVTQLQTCQEGDGFYTEQTSIDVIAWKDMSFVTAEDKAYTRRETGN
jgi:hypothetical protein